MGNNFFQLVQFSIGSIYPVMLIFSMASQTELHEYFGNMVGFLKVKLSNTSSFACYLDLGFKTTRTVMWYADHTALCGPHPHSRLKNLHTTMIFPQFILAFFVNFWRKKFFQRDF